MAVGTNHSRYLTEDTQKYLQKRLPAIGGIEIVIERIEGKFKFNQNKPVENQHNILAHFASPENENAQAIAEIMRRNLPN